jgi:hypothetical protein
MAKLTRDPESSATWNRMAARWRQCADKFMRESLAAKTHPPKRYRKAEPGCRSIRLDPNEDKRGPILGHEDGAPTTVAPPLAGRISVIAWARPGST